jgi:hypothetical protein
MRPQLQLPILCLLEIFPYDSEGVKSLSLSVDPISLGCNQPLIDEQLFLVDCLPQFLCEFFPLEEGKRQMLDFCGEFALAAMVLEDFSKEKHCFVSLSLSIRLL